MSLTKSDEYTEDWRERTAGGVVPTAILIILIVIFMLFVNTF